VTIILMLRWTGGSAKSLKKSLSRKMPTSEHGESSSTSHRKPPAFDFRPQDEYVAPRPPPGETCHSMTMLPETTTTERLVAPIFEFDPNLQLVQGNRKRKLAMSNPKSPIFDLPPDRVNDVAQTE
jgi:hypothetical protein